MIDSLKIDPFGFREYDARWIFEKDINLNGTNISIIDENTCEVSLSTDSSINQLIEELSKQGIKVKSLKNKTSRLEELFIRMVDKNGK